MNSNSTVTNGSHTLSVTFDGDPPYNNVQITDPKRCKNPFCHKVATFGSDYCNDHQSNLTDPWDDPITNTKTGPSNRDLQRQLDRLEGKIDALIAAIAEVTE